MHHLFVRLKIEWVSNSFAEAILLVFAARRQSSKSNAICLLRVFFVGRGQKLVWVMEQYRGGGTLPQQDVLVSLEPTWLH